MKLLEMPKERNHGTGKSQMTMIVFAASGRSKFANSNETIEVVVCAEVQERNCTCT